ncbi:MAG: response regulator transcription factor, partial [Candidatus Dormibacteraceae bacterium]
TERAVRLLRTLGVRVPGPPRRTDASGLSPRELEVVRLVAENLTSAQIAERLVISPRTVTTHLDRIYNRLGLNSRTALVRYALETGLLEQIT